jgi:hypothetical protein
MKDGNLAILYTKETREYARHVRYWRDVRGFASLALLVLVAHEARDPCMCDVWGAPRPEALRACKQVTLQVITLSPSWLASSRRYVINPR